MPELTYWKFSNKAVINQITKEQQKCSEHGAFDKGAKQAKGTSGW